MKPILTTAGSNSPTSINYQLASYTAGLVEGHPVNLIRLTRFEIPMYSEDLEKAQGIPAGVDALYGEIRKASGLILSVNEHNGNPSAFFKNVLDWLSRKERNFMEGLPVFLMSASGGRRGGIGSRTVVEQMLPRFGARVLAAFSLPSYYENFDPSTGLKDPGLEREHRAALEEFLQGL